MLGAGTDPLQQLAKGYLPDLQQRSTQRRAFVRGGDTGGSGRIEQSAYNGLYFVLMGDLPLDAIGPQHLPFNRLLQRWPTATLRDDHRPNTTSEARPPLYISELLASHKVKVSRISRGIPMGGELEFVDSYGKSMRRRDT